MQNNNLDNQNKDIPQDIDAFRNTLLEDIDNRIVLLQTYDYSYEPVISMINHLSTYPEVKNYFKDNDFHAFFRSIMLLSEKILLEYSEFVRNCNDYAMLLKLKEGLNSHSPDFQRFKSSADIDEAVKLGVKTNMQHSPEVTDSVARLTSENINVLGILEAFSADNSQESQQIIKDMILGSAAGYPSEPSELVKIYKDFAASLAKTNAEIDPAAAALKMIDFIAGVKVIADKTDTYVKDIISNIFNILANYFNGIEMGSYFASME